MSRKSTAERSPKGYPNRGVSLGHYRTEKVAYTAKCDIRQHRIMGQEDSAKDPPKPAVPIVRCCLIYLYHSDRLSVNHHFRIDIQKRNTTMVDTAISSARKPTSREKETRRILPNDFIIPPFAIYVHDSPAGIALVISHGILKRPQ